MNFLAEKILSNFVVADKDPRRVDNITYFPIV
jgi:hypothetical protein